MKINAYLLLSMLLLSPNLGFSQDIASLHDRETVSDTSVGLEGKSDVSRRTVSISGSVFDFETDEALVGAMVRVVGEDVKTYTDFDGVFRIDGLQPGDYDLVISYISYKKHWIDGLEVLRDRKRLEFLLQDQNWKKPEEEESSTISSLLPD